MYVLFPFTYYIPVHTAVLTFLSLMYGKGGVVYIQLTTTASSLGIHTTTVKQ